jgi:uncharacterized protein (DUF1499 family)
MGMFFIEGFVMVGKRFWGLVVAVVLMVAAVPSCAIAGGMFTGTPGADLGVREGSLAGCPQTPNCISSRISPETDGKHGILPLTYKGDRAAAKEALLKVLSVVPRTVVVESGEDYIRYESKSKLFGFVDDGEFYFPKDEAVIQLRSAARMGESDLGVNRTRVEQIRLAMKDLGF